MTLDPFLNCLNILLAVLEILIHVLGIAVEEVRLRWRARVNWLGPGAVLDSSSEIVLKGVGLGGEEVHVFGAGW